MAREREPTVYAVTDTTDPAQPTRLVRAWSRAHATRHVANSMFTTTVASPEACVAVGKQGGDIEDATGERDREDDDDDSTDGSPPPAQTAQPSNTLLQDG